MDQKNIKDYEHGFLLLPLGHSSFNLLSSKIVREFISKSFNVELEESEFERAFFKVAIEIAHTQFYKKHINVLRKPTFYFEEA